MIILINIFSGLLHFVRNDVSFLAMAFCFVAVRAKHVLPLPAMTDKMLFLRGIQTAKFGNLTNRNIK
jgi:hypothetical protein